MQKLKDSELRYRRLFETAQDGILILDARTGMIEDVNPYLIKMLGYSREEFVKKKLWEVGAFKDVEASQDAFEAFQKKEYIRYEDLPLRAKDGKLIQVEFVSNVYMVGGEKVIQCDIRDITEHKRILAALQENEKKYYDLVNQSPDGIFIIELSGKIITVNKAMCRELGFSEEEFLSMNIWDIIPQQYLDQHKKRLTKILNGESFEEAAEYAVHGRDEKIHYVEVLSTPHYNGKDIIGFQGTARDITARKQAERALLASEARYRRLFEAAQDGVLILDSRTGMIEDVNPYLIKMLGYSREEFIKKKLWEVGAFRDIEASKEAFEALQEKENIRYDDLPLKTKGGRLIQVEFVSNVYLVDNEKVIQCNIRDITERKRIEGVLLKSEQRYHILFESMMDGIYRSTHAGKFVDVNPALVKMFGYSSKEEMLAVDIKQELYFTSEERGSHILATGQEEIEVYRMRRKDGSEIWVEDHGYYIHDEQGRPTFHEGMLRDITARKQAEEALHNSEIKLRSLFAAMLDVIIVYDADGRYLEIAPTNFTNLYRPLDEMLGRTVTELFPPDLASFFLDRIHKTLETGQLTNAEYSLSIGSQVRWFSASVSPLSSNSVIWVAHDITLRKAAEQQIQRQLEHLTALSAIDRVIAANFDLKLSLLEILTHVTKELGVDAADIFILNPDSQMLEFGAERGFRTKAVKNRQVRLGESYPGRVALERQLVQILNLKDEPDNLMLTTILADENFICYYGVPLIAKGLVKGVLEVFHRSALEPDEEWFDFLDSLAGQTAIAIENVALFESLQSSNVELSLAYDATIEGWSRAIDLRDQETEGHSQRVTELTVKLARAFGFRKAELVQVRWGALLHDIGKMGVPDGILFKPGPLTEEEWVTMKKHPTFAYEMLSPIRYLRLALDIPYSHHEKWDGTGYPHGLNGTQIPLVARIFAVVDVWDALSSDRPYRSAWTEEEVLTYIRTESGTHFDPQVVDIFMLIPK